MLYTYIYTRINILERNLNFWEMKQRIIIVDVKIILLMMSRKPTWKYVARAETNKHVARAETTKHVAQAETNKHVAQAETNKLVQ